jgi:hypothetical protein
MCGSFGIRFLILLTFWPATLLAQPANNDFSNAETISGCAGSVAQSTVGATREIGEPNHGGDPGGASVWFIWEAPADGAAAFDLHDSDFDTTLSAYTGTALESLTAVAENDDAFDYYPLISQWLVRGTQSHIRFPAQAGTRYHIAVDGAGGLAGNIKLSWNLKSPPANDNFASAQVINGADGFISTHNVGATREAGEPNHATNAGSASIWFCWTAPQSGTTRFYTLNSLTSLSEPLDTLLAVYTGDHVDALTQVAANDNNGSSLRSLVQFTASAGTTYHIAVDTKAGPTDHGHILLTWVNGTPANNNFTSAQRITGVCGYAQGHNTSATRESGEPAIMGNNGGASIWYSWTAPVDGEVMFTTMGSPFLDTMVAVYTGVSVNALTLVVENDDVTGGYLDELSYSRVEFTARAGTTYRIVIDGYRTGTTPATGVTFLHWALDAPVNDDFSNAHELPGAAGTVTDCNAFSTMEVGERSHGGNEGGRSIWYRWQAPTSGVTVIDLAGSMFDTLLAVYRADGAVALNQLTLIAQNDDWFDGFNLAFHSRVEFGATAGVTYYIAVDGANDGAGYISDGWMVMSYTLYPVPVLQISGSGQNIVIHWDGPFTLESTTVLDNSGAGNWTTVAGMPPVTLPASSVGNRYFRAVHP